METKGVSVNSSLYLKEVELIRHLRYSKEERFPRLRHALWELIEKHLDKPL